MATALEVLDSGSHVVVSDDLYGGTFRLFERVRRRSANLDFTFIDMSDPENVERAMRPNTRMVWIETPSNPLLKVDRPRSGRENRARAQCDLRFRQHLRESVDSAADRIRFRHGHSFRHEISQRPFRHGRRRYRRRRKQGARRSNRVSAKLGRRDRGTVRQLSGLARVEDAGVADGAALRERDRDCATGSRRTESREGDRYPGLKTHPQHELARSADAGFGGMVTHRFENRPRGHASISREHASVLARRKSGWR